MTSRPALLLATIAIAACGAPRSEQRPSAGSDQSQFVIAVVRDSVIASTQDANGVAAPFQQAVISTKLMGTVIEVLVREGDHVSVAQALLRIDARDVDAKGAQVAASVAAAEATQASAQLQLKRMRALFTDSAATRAMLDAAETGAAQANAGVGAARAAAAEVAAVKDYAMVRAPFAGIVTKRFVDAGSFAAPGVPLVQVQDISRLRLTVTAPPDAARAAHRGATLNAEVDGHPVAAVVEGVVPSPAGGVYVINAIVSNPSGLLSAGSAALVRLPAGTRHAMLIPDNALIHNGDLTGVRVRVGTNVDVRWVKVGDHIGTFIEILSGLRVGEPVLVVRGAGK